MIQANLANSSEAIASSKHCVFCCKDAWYSIPAVSVREIVISPSIVPVPTCHPSLLGLCHLRNEFIPVIELNGLLQFPSKGTVSETNSERILICNFRTPWGIRISESATLEDLEASIAPQGINDAIIGTAMVRDSIVRILHPNRLYKNLHQTLERYWSKATHTLTESLPSSPSLPSPSLPSPSQRACTL